ncbi:MAG: hypothetical protein KY468_16110 [Armatimonadetes bacterium]|nr:hypothetical protein [Armatimonadota bacterium]
MTEILTQKEKQVIGECLRAAAEGPFFPDWEFSTLFGLDREEVKQIAEAWPDIDGTQERVGVGINNALNNLLGYPHHKEGDWAKYISVSEDEVDRIFCKWRYLSEAKGEGFAQSVE